MLDLGNRPGRMSWRTLTPAMPGGTPWVCGGCLRPMPTPAPRSLFTPSMSPWASCPWRSSGRHAGEFRTHSITGVPFRRGDPRAAGQMQRRKASPQGNARWPWRVPINLRSLRSPSGNGGGTFINHRTDPSIDPALGDYTLFPGNCLPGAALDESSISNPPRNYRPPLPALSRFT